MSGVWQLAHDMVLPVGGRYGTVAHVRVHEPPPAGSRCAPITIAGQVGDHTGQPPNDAPAHVTAPIQQVIFPSGRCFNDVEYPAGRSP